MKRKIALFMLVALLLFVNINTAFAGSSIVERADIKIYIDGKLGVYTSNPIIISGRTFLPLREILINLGVQNDDAHILWNGTEKSVTVKKDKVDIYLKVGSKSTLVNGSTATLDAAPVNYNGRVFIPVGFVAKSFGASVEWDGKTNSVIIGETPSSEVEQVIVGTAEEFVKEIGSNKRILLKPGIYDLSSIEKLDRKDGTVTWKKVDDGKELNLSNISDLTIESSNIKIAEIRNSPRFAEIINFNNCDNITLKNIKAGHTPAEYECNSGVLYFEDCSDINISNSELYGCGSIGINAFNTVRLNCIDTLIDHCSLRAIQLFNSEEIKFSGCRILSHEAYSNIVYLNDSKKVTFEQCEFSDNNYFEWSFFEASGESDLLIDKCIITDNSQAVTDMWGEVVYLFKTTGYDGTSSSNIVVRDTEISNNTCDYLYDNEESVIFENCKINNNVMDE